MDQLPSAARCLVTPERPEVLGETLGRFLGDLGPVDEGWRAQFEAAVAEAVSAVMERTRPRQVLVTLAVESGAVVATVHEAGQWWEGEPAPARVLDELVASRRGLFDDVRHWSDGSGHSWSLGRRVATLPAAPKPSPGRARPADLRALASAVSRLAVAPGDAGLPHLDRADELGELARAIGPLREQLVEREILVERAPVAISWLTADLRWRDVNREFLVLHGGRREDWVGRSMLENMDPAVLAKGRSRILAASDEHREVVQWRNRYVRPDRTSGWLAITSIPLRDRDGAVTGWLAFSLDDTERMLAEEQAADLQRRMFPESAPALPGYDLAGRCLPADFMTSGDLYDWEVPHPGQLDVTLADVMGKGPGAAMAMAALRTALRATRADMAPARRLQRAAEAMASVASGDLFITVFCARVDLDSGAFRFVDAGHGHWAIRRAGGELVRGGRRSLPLFVNPRERLLEGEARLGPGDSLIAYSDGLVEVRQPTLTLEDYAEDLAAPGDAAALVQRLLGRMPADLRDDVTVLVLRRTPH